MQRASSFHGRAALALIALAMLLRVLVPAGWMPVAMPGGFAIQLCNAGVMETAWVGLDGSIHKQKPGEGKAEPCAFAGLGAPGDLPRVAGEVLAPVAPAVAYFVALSGVSVGRGLAAPPPPATGPPHSL